MLGVLPFRNLSADDSLGFLGQAIAKDLLNGVALIPELCVKASYSSFALASEAPSVFADRLGVNRLLDGTFRVQDGNLRLSARLVDTESGDVVWSRVLTDSFGNIYPLQDQMAQDIASAFGLLHPSSAGTTSRQVDPDVFRLYLQAREGMVNPWMDTGNTMARVREILKREPNFPAALMFMGFLNTGRAWMMEDRADRKN